MQRGNDPYPYVDAMKALSWLLEEVISERKAEQGE